MSSSSPKFCPACGHGLQPNAKFCPDCGEKITAPAAASTPAEGAETVVTPATSTAPEAPKTEAPKAEAPKPAPKAAVKSMLGSASDDDDDDHDHLPPPKAAKRDDDDDDDVAASPKKSIPIQAIAAGVVVLVLGGLGAFLASDSARMAAFQCNVLGQKDKCDTDEMKLARLNKQRNEEEQQLMVSSVAEFGLSYFPKETTWVTIVQKRYEETREEFVARVRDGKDDKRKLVETKYGDYKQIGVKGQDGQVKGAIAFVTEEEWKSKHSAPDTQPSLIAESDCSDSEDNDFDGKFDCVDEDCAKLPVCTTPPKPGEPARVMAPIGKALALPTGVISFWPKKNQEVSLPLNVQNIPMLEKEQADGTNKRLNAEAVAELAKKIEEAGMKAKSEVHKEGEAPKADPSLEVKTVAVSTWVYEIHLWSPSYFKRDVLFYDDPLPPDLDKKKLEAEKWTLRKFKRTPDGKLVIDNASFDLLPEPTNPRLVAKYLRVLRETKCLKESKEYAGKSDQGKLDDEALLWEQAAVTKEERELVQQNEKPEFENYAAFQAKKTEMLKTVDCKKAAAQ